MLWAPKVLSSERTGLGISVRCKKVSEKLPLLVDGTIKESRSVRRHLSQCLRCQAELAKYRKLERLLDELAFVDADVPNARYEVAIQDVRADTSGALGRHWLVQNGKNSWRMRLTSGAVPTSMTAIAMSLTTIILMVWRKSPVHRFFDEGGNGAITAFFSHRSHDRNYPTLLTRQSIK